MCWRVIQGGGSDGEEREGWGVRGKGGVGGDGEGGSWGVMEGGGLMGNDGGGRQWWGFMEGEGAVCWASHFVRGPSIFVCARLFSLVRGRLRPCTVVLIPARSSASFEWSW